jgi:hypothetical protein
MANNRELSQLGSFIVVDDSTKQIGIATTAAPYVGIGTTNPTSKLTVEGDVLVSGVVTAKQFNGDVNAGVATITTLTSTTLNFINVNSTGITTLGVTSTTNLTAQQLNVSGVGTIATLYGGSAFFSGNVSIAGTLTYEDVTNIDAIGVVTARSDVIVGGGLSVTGITTLASAGGITTTGGDLYVGNELYVQGGVKVTNTGIVTSSNPGITTVVYYGDGSNLFGVSAFAVINQDLSSSIVYPTLANNSGVSTVGIATTGTNSFVFQPSTGNVGLGSLQPNYKIDAVGDINITGDYRVNGRSVLDDALIYSIVFG